MTKKAAGVDGYEAVNVSFPNHFSGLEYNTGGHSLLDGEVGTSNWWYAVGSVTRFNGGIPGPLAANGHGVPQPMVELLVRSADDSGWILLLRQTDGWFFKKDEFVKNPANPNGGVYAALDQLESHRGSDGKFLLMLRWPESKEAAVSRWEQTSDPMGAGPVTGFKPIGEVAAGFVGLSQGTASLLASAGGLFAAGDYGGGDSYLPSTDAGVSNRQVELCALSGQSAR